MLAPLRKIARFLPLFLVSLSAAACGSSEAEPSDLQAPSPPDAEKEQTDQAGAERAIAEADIVQLADGRLYAMSKSGTVAVVDVSTPGRLALLGKTRLPGQPFEMYRRGNLLVTMSNAAFEQDGRQTIEDESRPPSYRANASSAVIVLDVSNPANMRTTAVHAVPGKIDDSRVVGDVLYLVTTENGTCWRCEPGNRTRVTSFGMKELSANATAELPKIDEIAFPPSSYGGASERSVSTGKDRLYVGGGHLNPGTYASGELDVLDISDPNGQIVRGAHLELPGPIYTRWQVDERDGVLRVISQPGAYGNNSSYREPHVNTFKIESSQSLTSLGHLEMDIPYREGLRGVRFDKDRAYAITYRRTDPLYTIDLSNPAEPRQRGELVIPGFVFHLEPRGDRVLGLGVDTFDREGNINVSLFDVSDLDNPRMLERVSFGGTALFGNDAAAKTQLPEDYDRIQKAFKVLDDGLVVVPFSGTSGRRGTGDTCESVSSGVQLVEWKNDTLAKRAHLPLRGNPRRALQNQGELITVSDSNVRTFSLANKDAAEQTGDVVIGNCVSRYGYNEAMCQSRVAGAKTRDVFAIGSLASALAFVVIRRRRRTGKNG